jgi:hypothetical protein
VDRRHDRVARSLVIMIVDHFRGDRETVQARALGLMPVVGLGESGLAAAAGGRGFSILTLDEAMREPTGEGSRDGLPRAARWRQRLNQQGI